MSFKLPLLFVLFNFGSLIIAQSNYSFPDEFMFGTATAAYQIEGATSEDGKSENIWDYIIRTDPSFISNSANAEVACDSYHKYKEDVALLKELGVAHYRFSISWSRILSTLYQNEPNLAGIKYYQNLVDELLANNITPVATIHHWDLPQSLQDIGGWLNEEMVYHFENYARVLFTYLPKVAHWVTFNEPHTMCKFGYNEGKSAPALKQPGVADYTCAYVVLKSHAAAYHVYKDEFPELNGIFSIALDGHWTEPGSESTEDVEAAERRLQFENGLYAHPLVYGNWPQVVIDRVNYRSEMGNFTKSRLPVFTEEESNKIKGSFDVFSLNFYGSRNVTDSEEASFDETSYLNDMRVSEGGMGGGGGGMGGGGGGMGGGEGGMGGGEGGTGGGEGGMGGGEGGMGGGEGGMGGGEGGMGNGTIPGEGGLGGNGTEGNESEGGLPSGPGGLTSVGWALRKSLNWFKTQYGDLDYFIMENGVQDSSESNDETRMEYLQSFLTPILESIHEDGVNVVGYTYWALMDNFQWESGYDTAFGLYRVDFDDDNRTRTARVSTKYYKEIIETRKIPDEFPTSL